MEANKTFLGRLLSWAGHAYQTADYARLMIVFYLVIFFVFVGTQEKR